MQDVSNQKIQIADTIDLYIKNDFETNTYPITKENLIECIEDFKKGESDYCSINRRKNEIEELLNKLKNQK